MIKKNNEPSKPIKTKTFNAGCKIRGLDAPVPELICQCPTSSMRYVCSTEIRLPGRRLRAARAGDHRQLHRVQGTVAETVIQS